MPVYPVLQPLKHNGKAYAEGDTVEMEAKPARELALLGVLGQAPKPKAEDKKPEPKAKGGGE